MIRRHTEWVNLWNANCDSSKPRSKRELLQELDVWERTQGGNAPNQGGTAIGGSSVMRKDFDGAGWAANHDAEFKQLIASAQRKQRKPGTSTDTTVEEPDAPPEPVEVFSNFGDSPSSEFMSYGQESSYIPKKSPDHCRT